MNLNERVIEIRKVDSGWRVKMNDRSVEYVRSIDFVPDAKVGSKFKPIFGAGFAGIKFEFWKPITSEPVRCVCGRSPSISDNGLASETVCCLTQGCPVKEGRAVEDWNRQIQRIKKVIVEGLFPKSLLAEIPGAPEIKAAMLK